MFFSNIRSEDAYKRVGLKGRSFSSDKLRLNNWQIDKPTILLNNDTTSRFHEVWDKKIRENLKLQLHKPYDQIQVERRTLATVKQKIHTILTASPIEESEHIKTN
jgi:hypothetical protein